MNDALDSPVNPFNEEMVCSYNKSVDIKIESIDRERFVNKLKLSISVFPNLHVFRSINFYDLVSISHFFSIDSMSFDHKTSVIFLVIAFG